MEKAKRGKIHQNNWRQEILSASLEYLDASEKHCQYTHQNNSARNIGNIEFSGSIKIIGSKKYRQRSWKY